MAEVKKEKPSSALFKSSRGATGDSRELQDLVKHHIESYDYMVDRGLEIMLENIKPVIIRDPSTGTTLSLYLSNPKLYKPQKYHNSKNSLTTLLPFECRQARISYTGKFEADVCFQYNDGQAIRERFNFGQFPVMLKSKKCHLRDADPQRLVSLKEEAAEVGGYFISNGLERVVRCVILPKQNYPMSTERSSFRDRQEGFTDKAVSMRCVREFQSSLTDQTSVTVKLYYLRNGSARLGFGIRGREYLIPVGILLKAFVETTDREIYENLTSYYDEKYEKMKGAVGSQLVSERARIILDEVRDMSLFTQAECLQYIGEQFQLLMDGMDDDSPTNVAHAVLKDYVFIHLTNSDDKFNLLIFMLQKLFSLVDQTSTLDNPDSLQNQEILLPGHLITIYLKGNFSFS